MADRNRYPQLPDVNSSIRQQQQQQQLPQHLYSQSQQQLHGDTSSGPGNFDARMWAQMQQFNRTQPSGDTPQSNVNQQIHEFVRSTTMARLQGVQQQMGQQQQVSPGPMQPPTQQPSFQDQQTSQQHAPSRMPPNFSNLGSTQQLQLRNSMMQPFTANQNPMARQLDMLALAQQPQNGGVNMTTARMTQQQQQQPSINNQAGPSQSGKGNIFASPHPPDIRASPSRVALQPPFPSSSQGPGLNHTFEKLPPDTLAGKHMELRQRAKDIQSAISLAEVERQRIVDMRPTMTDVEFQAELDASHRDLLSKREILQKLHAGISHIQLRLQALRNGTSPNDRGNMNAMGSSPTQPPPGTQNQPGWPPQSGPPSQGPGFRHLGPSLGTQAQNLQASIPQLQGQPPNSMMNQKQLAPRSGPIPQQLLLNQQLPSQISPNVSNRFLTSSDVPQNMPNMFMTTGFPQPLSKGQFDGAYGQWCTNKGIAHDPRLMSVDGHPIDLHVLHFQVMSEGGVNKVTQNDLWPVIGGKMGFVQFPGHDNIPAKSAPAVAQHLEHVYREYVLSFDNVYIASLLKRRQQALAAGRPNPQPQAGGLALPPQNVSRTPGHMQKLVVFAHHSVNDLRARGVREDMIQYIEANRPALQRAASEQQAFHGMLSKNLQPPEMGGDHSGSFQPSSQQQNAALPSSMPQSGTQSVPPMPQQGSPAGPSRNGMDNRLVRPAPGPPLNSSSLPPQMRLTRPTEEQLHQSVMWVAQVRKEFMAKNIGKMPLHELSENERIEFSRTAEQLKPLIQDLENKLPMYHHLFKAESQIQRLIAMIITYGYQSELMQRNPPNRVLTLETFQSMVPQIRTSMIQFQNAIQQRMAVQQTSQPPSANGLPANASQGNPHQVSQPPPRAPTQSPAQHAHHSLPSHPQNHPHGPSQSLAPQNIPPVQAPPTSRQVPTGQQPPPMKKKSQVSGPSASSAMVSTPTPPTVSTPANATTPTHATSPQTPKSPKGKAGPKVKSATPRRKKSVVQLPEPTEAPQRAEPIPPQNLKRRREETPTGSSPATEASPPKKTKASEWDGPPSEELLQRRVSDGITTEEDAINFMSNMQQLIVAAAGTEGRESLSNDISETLDAILKGYGSAADLPETSLEQSRREPSPPPSHLPAADEFIEFFDFSSYGNPEDERAIATTPDLVSSSSTNPSPESNSADADALHHHLSLGVDNAHISDPKLDDSFETSDPLRLGAFREIDGGESAYYQGTEWKWDSPISTLDQPWAIFTS